MQKGDYTLLSLITYQFSFIPQAQNLIILNVYIYTYYLYKHNPQSLKWSN